MIRWESETTDDLYPGAPYAGCLESVSGRDPRHPRIQTRIGRQDGPRGIAYETIAALLQVSKPFISKWKRIYAETGVEGLRMGYRGTISYLSAAQRDQTLAWLRDQESWSVPALQSYLHETF